MKTYRCLSVCQATSFYKIVQVNLHPSFYFCYRVQFPSPHIVGVNSGSTVKMFDC